MMRSCFLFLAIATVAWAQDSTPIAEQSAEPTPPPEPLPSFTPWCSDGLTNRTLYARLDPPDGASLNVNGGVNTGAAILGRAEGRIIRVSRTRAEATASNVLSFASIAAVSGWRNAAAARDPSANLLADSGVVASSSDASSAPPAAATDGDVATAFVSGDSDDAWVEYTMFHTQPVTAIVLTAAQDMGVAGLANATVELLSAEHEVVASWRITASLAEGVAPGGEIYLYAADGCLDVRLAFQDFATRAGRSYRCVYSAAVQFLFFIHCCFACHGCCCLRPCGLCPSCFFPPASLAIFSCFPCFLNPGLFPPSLPLPRPLLSAISRAARPKSAPSASPCSPTLWPPSWSTTTAATRATRRA